MERKTGIGSLYDEFFRGYGAEIRPICPDFRLTSTYKHISATSWLLLWAIFRATLPATAPTFHPVTTPRHPSGGSGWRVRPRLRPARYRPAGRPVATPARR
jgi:hypothetical protein